MARFQYKKHQKILDIAQKVYAQKHSTNISDKKKKIQLLIARVFKIQILLSVDFSEEDQAQFILNNYYLNITKNLINVDETIFNFSQQFGMYTPEQLYKYSNQAQNNQTIIS